MDISEVYVGQDDTLLGQLMAIEDYCKEYHQDFLLLAALGSFSENLAVRQREISEVLAEATRNCGVL